MSEIEGVVVVGVGTAELRPDRVRAHVGVSTVAATIREALASAATAQDAVVGAATAAGIDRDALQTTGYHVGPDHQMRGDPSWYRAELSLTLVLDDLAGAGALLGAMADVAGDAFRVHGVRPESSGTDGALSTARSAAVAAARGQAEELAVAAGVTLGPLRSLVETSGGRPGAPRAAVMLTSSGGAPDVEGGMLTVQVAVTATYDITP